MDKSLIVVIDKFTDRVFEYENVLLLDYGYYSEIQMYDNFFWNGVQSGYGTYDDFYISQPPTGNNFYFVTPDADPSRSADFDATSTNDGDWDFKSTSTFTDIYGNPAVVDTYDVYTWVDQTDDADVGHGDWVVDTICSNLDNLERTTILCIDVDTLNGVDSHLDNLFGLDLYNSLLSVALVTKFESLISQFFEIFDQRFNSSGSPDQYVLAGASMSIAGSPASVTEGLVIQTFEDIGALLFQAAPNVGQGYYDWGSTFPDVINVGAWNEASDGNLLISSGATLDTLDIVADGYVTHPSWGTKFGTSFATPAVAAEYLNLVNDALIQINADGDSLPSEPTDAPEFVYSTFVSGVLDYISTPIYADFSDDGVNDYVEYRLLTTSLESNGVYPKALPIGSGLAGYQVTNVTQNANQEATFSNALLTSGVHSVGTTLAASIDFDDPNGVSNSSLTYTWYRKDGDSWSVVGETSNEYTIQSGDIGTEIRFQVSFTDDDGYAESSLAYGFDGKVVVEMTLTITGTATQGETLTAFNNLADIDGVGIISYQWNRDDVAITDATSNTYVLTQDDVDAIITVTASYTDDYGTNEAVTSSATTAVVNVNDSPTGTVIITGTATQGQTLTASNDLADIDGLGNISYQWNRDDVAITDATSRTYVLTQDDVDTKITVTASYTDDFGSNVSVESATTTDVININDLPTGVVSILGEAREGSVLTADITALEDKDGIGGLSYQWFIDGELVSGENTAALSLADTEIGSVISVDVSYTDLRGTTESISSLPTDPVVQSTATTLSISFVDRQGQPMSGVSGLMNEIAAGEKIFIRPAHQGANAELELVVRPTASINAINFFIEDSNSMGQITLADSISGWTLETDSSQENVFGFVGFGSVDESQKIMPNQETVIAKIMTTGDAPKEFEISITDVALGAEILADRTFTLHKSQSENGHVMFLPEDNSSVWIDGALDYSRSSRAITAQDALEAFRLAINQSTTSGNRGPLDYISADFDRNGSVTTNDALEILAYALRRPNYDADWVFIDAEADLNHVGRRSSSYETGKNMTEMNPSESAILIGVLLGDVDNSFV